MKFAVVARPPVVGGKLVSFDATDALKVPGVEKVVEVKGWPWPSKFMPLGGVAVVARNTGSAIKGREALKIVWDDGPNKAYDSDRYREALRGDRRKPGKVVRNEGDADGGAQDRRARWSRPNTIIPHLAHASMEPPSATAHVADGKCEVWAPTQSPGGTRDDLAKMLGIPVENVTVQRARCWAAGSAASRNGITCWRPRCSRNAIGAPIKLTWTREDDIQHDFYHTVSVERIDAGLDAQRQGHRLAAPQRGADDRLHLRAATRSTSSRSSWAWAWWTCPSPSRTCAARTGEAAAHTRIGWFRSVSNIPHGFAVQSMVAEIAHATRPRPQGRAAGADRPAAIHRSQQVGRRSSGTMATRFRPTRSTPAGWRGSTQIAAEQAGWGKALPKGQRHGHRAHRSFLSYVATVVEVAVDAKGNLSVPRVTRRSTAASGSTRNASARRSRAPR